MRVVIATDHPDSPVDQIMRAVAEAIKDQHEVEVVDRLSLGKADLDGAHVHLGMPARFSQELPCTVSLNVWSVPIDKAAGYQKQLRELDPIGIVVDDLVTSQILGQLGFSGLRAAPLFIPNPSSFQPLPPPEGPFTVGVFGNDYASKRFKVVEEACKIAGVRYFPVIQEPGRKHYYLDPLRDVYPHIHALAHASFTDTNSMPCMEALLCGRPVLSTWNTGMDRLTGDQANGIFFHDGYPENLAFMIGELQKTYEMSCREVEDSRPKITMLEGVAAFCYQSFFKHLEEKLNED